MELWDIYDRDKQRTGRTMKRNDWHMQPGDFHLTVLGVIRHTNGKYLITKRVMTKASCRCRSASEKSPVKR